ncbi:MULTISPECIES: serine hydrolase domain-containing protein [unclassified Streptomyces]|uniref:serine hydrolase domain-containing protein n=1 Tax=unclassified Streptomyces TaxID=2593676 RepID=UPI0037F9F40D
MNEAPSTLGDLGLFTGVPQHQHFCHMAELMRTRAMTAAGRQYAWPVKGSDPLPPTFDFGGSRRSTEEFLAVTDTAALLVLTDGSIRHEHYALTGGPDVPWLSMSVAKSFVSALVGIAHAEGRIPSLDAAVSDFVPVRPGSAYDGVAVRHVLQMSSGARWSEDYSDPESEVFRLAQATQQGGSIHDFVASMTREFTPGTVCRYNSADTQVLGELVVRATGRTLADYMQEKLCEPLGMTSPGQWLLDDSDTELAFNGLNLTARDYARLGELYRNGGVWQGCRVLPQEWVRDSVTVAAPHLAPGRVEGPGPLGYGYQWWIPEGDRGEFSAIGVYNQYVYVDPPSATTIVKLSANRAFGTSAEESTNHDMETLALLRAIARQNG